jgi:hypothetical protein
LGSRRRGGIPVELGRKYRGTFIILWRSPDSALQAQGTSVGKPGSITYRA